MQFIIAREKNEYSLSNKISIIAFELFGKFIFVFLLMNVDNGFVDSPNFLLCNISFISIEIILFSYLPSGARYIIGIVVLGK